MIVQSLLWQRHANHYAERCYKVVMADAHLAPVVGLIVYCGGLIPVLLCVEMTILGRSCIFTMHGCKGTRWPSA